MTLLDIFKQRPKRQPRDCAERVGVPGVRENPKTLAALAEYDPDPNVRYEAVCRVDDPLVLAYVAGDDPSKRVRDQALYLFTQVDRRRIIDSPELREICRTNGSAVIRKLAVGEVDDEAVLLDVLRNDPDLQVRLTALGRIRDDKIRFDIVKSDADNNIRSGALDDIDNDAIRGSLALDVSLPLWIRQKALSSIRDEAILDDIISSESIKTLQNDARAILQAKQGYTR